MTFKGLIHKLLDKSIVFSFDRTGFKRHCQTPLIIPDLSARSGIVTGATSGIGLATAKALASHGMHCHLIGRDLEKIKRLSESKPLSQSKWHQLDMSDLKKVYSFAENEVKSPIDLLIHNAGGMPNERVITKEGYEHMFASQVLAPFILTKRLADLGKLSKGCRIIFVSSGGMYLQKLDLSDLKYEKHSYSKYTGYANAKRAQVVLSELFSKEYPEFLFSAMHPGWADTAGIRYSLPFFTKLLSLQLRSTEEGADTILWLAINNYPTGKFWFDRKQEKTMILHFAQHSKEEEVRLWNLCNSIIDSIQAS
ncbi:MAG: SDR family NAD(P)-dependent oxidoreductase [Waddliaceae bacterium]